MTLAGMAAVEAEENDAREQVRPGLLRLGMWSAWAVVTFGVAYIALVARSGALSGAPTDPFWAAAEAVTVVGAPIQVVLFAVIYQLSPAPARVYGLLAFGFMLAMAALTTTVHLSELFVARRIDLAGDPALGRIFGFTQPSLLFCHRRCSVALPLRPLAAVRRLGVYRPGHRRLRTRRLPAGWGGCV